MWILYFQSVCGGERVAKIVKRRIFSGSACEQIVYIVEPTRSRFRDEAEREAHRQEIGRRMAEHFAETASNPHERKIDAILASKRNRVPIYATLPARNGKRFRRYFSEPNSKITFR